MLKLLIKTLGLSFYQQHAGLFLIVFYLLFGAVEGSQLVSYHLAILMAVCSSPLVLLMLYGLWILYAIKSLLFVHKKLTLTAYSFAKSTTLVSKNKQIGLWFKLYSFLLIPILIYAAFILMISIKHQFYFSFFATIIGLALILLVLAVYTFKQTNYSFKPTKVWVNLPNIKINKPFWLWPIFYLLNEQKLMLVVCKVVSIIFFKAILLLFADVGNDTRVYLTALLAVVLSHAVLIFTLIKFDAFYIGFAKAIPLFGFKRLINWIAILTLLLLPEFGLLIWFTQFDLLQIIIGILFSMSSMLCLFVLIYLLKADIERYMKYLLFFFFVSMFAILAHYYLLFSITILVISVIVFLWRYPKIDLKEIAG